MKTLFFAILIIIFSTILSTETCYAQGQLDYECCYHDEVVKGAFAGGMYKADAYDEHRTGGGYFFGYYDKNHKQFRADVLATLDAYPNNRDEFRNHSVAQMTARYASEETLEQENDWTIPKWILYRTTVIARATYGSYERSVAGGIGLSFENKKGGMLSLAQTWGRGIGSNSSLRYPKDAFAGFNLRYIMDRFGAEVEFNRFISSENGGHARQAYVRIHYLTVLVDRPIHIWLSTDYFNPSESTNPITGQRSIQGNKYNHPLFQAGVGIGLWSVDFVE